MRWWINGSPQYKPKLVRSGFVVTIILFRLDLLDFAFGHRSNSDSDQHHEAPTVVPWSVGKYLATSRLTKGTKIP
jgi:hypothetical protein